MNNIVKFKKKTKPKQDKKTPQQAQHKINDLAKDTEKVAFSDHVYERMDKRGFLDIDVIDILRDGVVKEDAELDEHGCWRYQIEYHKFRGCRDAAIVTVIVEDEYLELVTVKWMDWK